MARIVQYFLTSVIRRALVPAFIGFDRLIESILRENVNYKTETENFKEKIYDFGGFVFAGYYVALLTELIRPIDAEDTAGEQVEEQGYAAAELVSAGSFVCLVGEADEPIDGINAAGDEREDNGEHDVTGLKSANVHSFIV